MTEEEKILQARPQGHITVISRPAWWSEIAAGTNGSILQVHHPEHGWLTFLLPPESANHLGTLLVKQAALCEYLAGTLPSSTVTVN